MGAKPGALQSSIEVKAGNRRQELLAARPEPEMCGLGSWPSRPWVLKEEDILIMRVKALQNNCNGTGKKDVMIHKHDAVCQVCSVGFGNNDVLNVKCNCGYALMHEDCATKCSKEKGNNKCHLCDQDIQNIPVTLSRAEEQNLGNPILLPKGERSSNLLWCFTG